MLPAGRALGCEPGVNPPQACADSQWPQLVGAQYTYVSQTQTRLVSPYRGRLSLDPDGDTQSTHTIGLYFGWAARWATSSGPRIRQAATRPRSAWS
jgi:hypothetical protein